MPPTDQLPDFIPAATSGGGGDLPDFIPARGSRPRRTLTGNASDLEDRGSSYAPSQLGTQLAAKIGLPVGAPALTKDQIAAQARGEWTPPQPKLKPAPSFPGSPQDFVNRITGPPATPTPKPIPTSAEELLGLPKPPPQRVTAIKRADFEAQKKAAAMSALPTEPSTRIAQPQGQGSGQLNPEIDTPGQPGVPNTSASRPFTLGHADWQEREGYSALSEKVKNAIDWGIARNPMFGGNPARDFGVGSKSNPPNDIVRGIAHVAAEFIDPMNQAQFATDLATKSPGEIVGGMYDSVSPLWSEKHADGSDVTVRERAEAGGNLLAMLLMAHGMVGHGAHLVDVTTSLHSPEAIDRAMARVPLKPEQATQIHQFLESPSGKVWAQTAEQHLGKVAAPVSTPKPKTSAKATATKEVVPDLPSTATSNATSPSVREGAKPPRSAPADITVKNTAAAAKITDAPPPAMQPGDAVLTESGARWQMQPDRSFVQTHGFGGEAIKGAVDLGDSALRGTGQPLPGSTVKERIVPGKAGEPVKVPEPAVKVESAPAGVTVPKGEVKRPWEMTREEFYGRDKQSYAGPTSGTEGFTPKEAEAEHASPTNPQFRLTSPRVEQDARGAGTPFEYTRPIGKTVTLYRAVPNGIDWIEPGQYASLSRAYAEDHLRGHLEGRYTENPELAHGGKIVKVEVPASDVTVLGANEVAWTPADSLEAVKAAYRGRSSKPPRTSADAMADFHRLVQESKDSGSAGVSGGEKLSKLIEAGGYLVEAGIRTAKEWGDHMVAHFGEEVRPHLEEIWDKVKPKEAEAKPKEEAPPAQSAPPAPEPAPAPKPKTPNPEATGIAQSVHEQRGVPVKPGKGATPEEMIRRGRELEKEAPSRIQAFEKDGRVSGDDIAAFRARFETLSKATRRALEAYDAKPSPETYKALQDAKRAEHEWAQRIKPAQTEFQRQGVSMQGKTDLDTGSWSALAQAAADTREGGATPTPREIAAAKGHAQRINTLNTQVAELQKKLADTLWRKRTTTATTTTLPKTAEGLRAHFAKRIESGSLFNAERVGGKRSGAVSVGGDPKFTPEENLAIWNFVKENYLTTPGEMTLDEIAEGVGTDLGLKPEWVKRAIAGPKSDARAISAEMFRKMSAQRRAVASAKSWVDFSGQPQAKRVISAIWNYPRALAVTGHGTVGMFTHAGPVAFSPRDMTKWGRNFGNQFKMVASPGVHEALVQRMMRKPLYNQMLNDGLKVDMAFQEDYQRYGKSGGAGNRGFDSLKLLRAEMYEDYMSKVPGHLKADVGPMMADLINTTTGSGKGSMGKVGKFMFAPSLEVSRWERAVIDPVKTLGTYANWKNATPAERYMAWLRTKRTVGLVATYLSALGVNYGLQAFTGQTDKVNFMDPTKSDWLRFKWNGQTFDPLGGATAPLRLLAGIAKIAATDPTKFQVQTGNTRKDQIGSDITNYAIGKLSPTYAIPLEIFGTHADFQGRPLPNASDLEKARAEKQGKVPLGWAEYGFSKGPIPFADVTQTVLDGLRDGGVKPDAASIVWGGMKRLAVAATGIREGVSPKPQKTAKLPEFDSVFKAAGYSYTGPKPEKGEDPKYLEKHPEFVKAYDDLHKAEFDKTVNSDAFKAEKSATERNKMLTKAATIAGRKMRANPEWRARRQARVEYNKSVVARERR